MGPSFPIPVLAVTADAVRDLDGHEALSGLWTLFTKCKESLQDGRRLENISWRLWYRELTLTDRHPLNNSTQYPSEELLDEKHPHSNPLSSSFSSAASSSSSSSYSPSHSPALSHTSSVYRPPTPAESVNVDNSLSSTLHDPEALQGSAASSMYLQRLSLTDLPPSSSLSSVTVLATPNIHAVSHHAITPIEPYSALPSPLPSPSIPQSIPHSIPPSTAPLIPDASSSIEPPASIDNLSSSTSQPTAPSISHSHSQSTYVPPHAHLPHHPSSSSSPELSHPRARPAIARSHTESSVLGAMDATRTRRSSFAGMSIGRIICDMLPKAGAELCSSAGGGGGCGQLAADAEMRRERREAGAGADQATSLKVAPGMQMTPLAAAAVVAAAAATAISHLPTPETEERESSTRLSAAPREEGREAAEEAARELREGGGGGGAGGARATLGRLPGDGAAHAVVVASSAFAAHVAHVAGAAASEVAQALALAGEVGGGVARQREVGVAPAATGEASVIGRGNADRGDGNDRRGDKDKDRHGAALAPRGLLVGDVGAYPVSGERIGLGGAEEERDTYSGTSTPTHTHTPPQIYQPLQDAPQPPRLVVVNPTPNLTPHPTPPSTPIAFAGLPRAFAPGPGQWLMPPGHQARAPGNANVQMQQYQLQHAQLAQLLPPLTLPPPPQAGLRTHVLDGATFVTGSVSGSSHLQAGHVPSATTSDRAEKSAAGAGAPGAASRPAVYQQYAPSDLTGAGVSHVARGQRHEDAQIHSHTQHAAHHSHTPQYLQQQQQHWQSQFAGYSQHGLLPDGYGYSHAHVAHGRAVAELVVPAQAALLLEGAGAGADGVEGVHLLGLLPPLPVPGNTATSKTPTPGASTNATSGIGNVNASRDNVNRRSISSNTSTSSQTTTASLQSMRSRATDSSSATSASARSKTTAGEGFGTVIGEEFSDAIFGGQFVMVEAPTMNVDMGAVDGRSQTLGGGDDNDEALEEEEDDPLSPLPTVSTFGVSISPRTNDKTSRNNKRHSAPPRSTSDSTQMRMALSLSPVSPVSIGDAEPTTTEQWSQQQETTANVGQPPQRTAARSRSASSTRSVGKRSSLSASSKASRKGSTGALSQPQTATTTALTATTSSTTSTSTSTKTAGTTRTTNSTAVRRSSSTSQTRSAAGSSLGKSRSRSREPGLGVGLGMTTTAAQAAAAAVAAAIPSAATRIAKPSVRGKAKFSLGRAGNKKSAALLAMRRNSSGMTGKGKAKQTEEEEEDDDDEEDGDAGGRNAGDDDDEMIDLGELNREVAEAQAEGERREREARERMRVENEQREQEKKRELMHLQEQARRAARAEEEKERRRQAERHQRKLDTIAALTAPATADNVSETSSKRPVRFNIGSNSDDGMGGKSAGSGSEVSGGVSGQSVGVDTGAGGVKGRGKEEMPVEQRLVMQQQYQQAHLQQQQPHPNRSTSEYMHANRQLSKPQLQQLLIMEQMHQQNQRPTAAQQQVQQYQQQFQTQVQPPQPQPPQQVITAVENINTSKKGKQREAAVALPAESSTKPKKGNSKATNGPTDMAAVDAMLAAQIQDSLNTPLLPTGKKRVELVSTESEFETTDDEGDDDGEWSSAEMTADDEEVHQTQEQEEQQRLFLLQIQQQHDRQMQLLQREQREQQRHQQAARPQVPQRTHSSHYPAPNNARGRHLTRAQMQRQVQAQAQAQVLVDKAATEAQRQRDMFVKLPTSSFQDLAKARTNSVGLLTQLMNPDLEKFPPNHPYRRGFSSGELRRSGIAALSPMQAMTPLAAPNSNQQSPTPVTINNDKPPATSAVAQPTAPAPVPSDAVPAAVPSRPAVTRRNTADIVPNPNRTAFSPPLRSGVLALTRSSAALPTATQLQVGSVATKHAHRTSALLERVSVNGSGGSGGYRPRGPPEDQEMEDDSDSDEGVIHISKSVAQEKLKALAERRGIKPAAKNLDPNVPGPSNAQAAGIDDNDVPQWVVSQPQAQHQRSQSQGEPVQRRVPAGLQLTQVEAEEAPAPPATAPIKVDYPYNLPLPIPPSTPRTTRRNMLSTELTESLRRNVLWHRHVDKPNPAMRRSTSGGGSRNNVLGGVRPLTAAPSMVQLHAKGTKPEGTSQITRHEPLTDKEREEARQRRLARNKSWANDYHYSGW